MLLVTYTYTAGTHFAMIDGELDVASNLHCMQELTLPWYMENLILLATYTYTAGTHFAMVYGELDVASNLHLHCRNALCHDIWRT